MTMGTIPKNERKNTISPGGIPSEALSRLAIERKTATETTLKPIPAIGLAFGP
jgi:hypothetical protein